jgi:predicted PurR-regulated permease PerM
MNHRTAQTLFLGVLALIAVFAALRIGQGLFAPVLSALVFGVVCAPLADAVDRSGLPRALAALLVLGIVVVLIALLFALLEPTVTLTIRNAPAIWQEVTGLLDSLRGFMAGVEELQDTVSDALRGEAEPEDRASAAAAAAGAEPAGDAGAEEGEDAEEETAVRVPGVVDALFYAPSFAAALLIFAGTFYFFLLGRRDIYERIDRSASVLSAEMLGRAERRVSRYFLTITLINAGFGIVIWLAMSLIGLPQSVIWGLAAFLFNFVLYLGPAVLAAAFAVAGILVFEGALIFLPVAAYVSLNMVEGQFVTPTLVGRNMAVNPLLVFVSLVLWLWLWGPVGGIVAIPVLVWSLYILGHLDWDPRDLPRRERRRLVEEGGAPGAATPALRQDPRPDPRTVVRPGRKDDAGQGEG